MTTKNLEKLAEIGERKLLNDLTTNLIQIKLSWNDRKALNEKIKQYNHLITICKNCGLYVNEQEKIFNEIIKHEIKPYVNKALSEFSIQTQYGSEIKH